MRFRKTISILTLLALMLGNLTFSQHLASHVDHDFSQEVVASHDEHQKHHDSNQHECPECFLAKSLQTAFYNASALLPDITQVKILELSRRSFVVFMERDKANAPRAPPVILI